MSITTATHAYIRDRPHLQTCLELGVINYTALARLICSRLDFSSLDAVQMAIRRYPTKNTQSKELEASAIELISRAKLVLRTKIIVATVDKGNALQRAINLQQIIKKNKGDFRLIEGEDTFSIISTDDYLSAIKDTFRSSVQNVSCNLTQISMVFPNQITTTIGVSAYLYKLFAEHNININDEMSCWTDVMIIIADSDATKAVEILQRQHASVTE